jgi:hypothetical protein
MDGRENIHVWFETRPTVKTNTAVTPSRCSKMPHRAYVYLPRLLAGPTVRTRALEKVFLPKHGETRKSLTIECTVGDRGQEFYRLSCELPCIAMEELIDYIIIVGPKTAEL